MIKTGDIYKKGDAHFVIMSVKSSGNMGIEMRGEDNTRYFAGEQALKQAGYQKEINKRIARQWLVRLTTPKFEEKMNRAQQMIEQVADGADPTDVVNKKPAAKASGRHIQSLVPMAPFRGYKSK